MNKKLKLSLLQEKIAVCCASCDTKIDEKIWKDDFISITKTTDELSIVCFETSIPDNVKAEKNWRAFKVEGPLDFSLTGILASLANPLAEAKISIFAISTYDTDYLLVKNPKLKESIQILNNFCEISE
jgi:hypothetical protein